MNELMSFREIVSRLNQSKTAGQIIVLATGVFDLFHQEHRQFLLKAKQVGDVLVVGIESDKRVKEMKGEDRPINNQAKRLKSVLGLKAVDFAFILPENFSNPQAHEKLISQLRPDILAVSSHTSHLKAKREIVTKYNGRVEIVHQHNPLVSTSLFLNDKK